MLVLSKRAEGNRKMNDTRTDKEIYHDLVSRMVPAIYTTADVLSRKEIELILSGYKHMVDNGYGPINDIKGVLRVLATQIENTRREIRISKMEGRDTSEQEFRLNCEEHGLSNLISRTQ
jgi:hypothetical protein